MTTLYYQLTYGEYKKHAHGLLGTEHIAHSPDEALTDSSQLVLMVSGPRHVHHFLDQKGVKEISSTHEMTQALKTNHPIMRPR